MITLLLFQPLSAAKTISNDQHSLEINTVIRLRDILYLQHLPYDLKKRLNNPNFLIKMLRVGR